MTTNIKFTAAETRAITGGWDDLCHHLDQYGGTGGRYELEQNAKAWGREAGRKEGRALVARAFLHGAQKPDAPALELANLRADYVAPFLRGVFLASPSGRGVPADLIEALEALATAYETARQRHFDRESAALAERLQEAS